MKTVMKTETKMYKVLMSEIKGVPHRVMMSIIKHMADEMNTITINGDTLDQIKDECGVSEQQVRDAVSSLSKLGLVEPTKMLRAEYVVNPMLCYKGSEEATWNMYNQIEEQRKDTRSVV